MIGNEQTELRQNLHQMIARKSGDPPMKRITRGGAETHSVLHHQLHSLQEIQLPPVQNPDGSFSLMKGWDLPQDP